MSRTPVSLSRILRGGSSRSIVVDSLRMSALSSMAASMPIKGRWALMRMLSAVAMSVYPAIPVCLWYASQKPPSITSSLPSPLMGLSPSMARTGL